jgi:hypothetical protein
LLDNASSFYSDILKILSYKSSVGRKSKFAIGKKILNKSSRPSE